MLTRGLDGRCHTILKPVQKQVLVVFVAVAIVPAGLAAWLAWRLMLQDRVIAGERLRDLRDRDADEAVRRISRALGVLAQETQKAPAGSVESPDAPLAYSPQPRSLPEAPPEMFAAAEKAEYSTSQTGDAIAIYRKLAESPAPAVRAGAWVRLGRTLRKVGRRDEAIRAYQQLGAIDSAAVGEAPAPLAAHWAIGALREDAGQTAELKKEGDTLRALLDTWREFLSREVYEAYAEDAARWSGRPRPVLSEALADAASSRRSGWGAADRDAASSRPSGGGAATFRGQLITWIEGGNRALLLTEDHAARLLPAPAVRVRFAVQAAKDEVLRRAQDTGLPWTLAIALANPERELASFDTQRSLLVWLLGLVMALGIGGGYLGWRLIRRELALARMQADIVAAVSHEFRTPLTSMRQISAALSEGRVSDEGRRQAYYDALARATSRLHRLVEDLLDFGKMESHAPGYRMETIDLAALTERVAGDFESETATRGFTLCRRLPSCEIPVRGDAEALRRALWNLLDNAVKYSGENPEASVCLSRNGAEAWLSVADKGVGIPPGEQPDVFRKFFRGATARQSHIRGSGIGLAMVDHIARAHCGRVTLESRPGLGSTFTIHLPMEE